jgi:hypothetical protein
MNKLKLPIIRKSKPSSKWLPMDEYLNFVSFNLRYTYNRKASRQWKKLLAVDVPFSLK